METLINGKSYNFAQIVLMLGGQIVADLKGVTYGQTQSKTNNYGAGTRPVSRGHGAIETNCSIDIAMNDVESLRDVSPGGSLLALDPFDIVVTYKNEGKVVTHVLKDAEFTSEESGGSQGDTELVKTFELVISEVQYRP